MVNEDYHLALSWVNSCFFSAGAAPLGSRASVVVGCATAAALKTSWSTYSASLVSPDTVRTPLLTGIFMRLYAGWVASMNRANAR